MAKKRGFLMILVLSALIVVILAVNVGVFADFGWNISKEKQDYINKLKKDVNVKVLENIETSENYTILSAIKDNRKQEEIKNVNKDWWNYATPESREEAEVLEALKNEKKVLEELKDINKKLKDSKLKKSEKDLLKEKESKKIKEWQDKKSNTLKLMEKYGFHKHDC